jgi:hypothetical protein
MHFQSLIKRQRKHHQYNREHHIDDEIPCVHDGFVFGKKGDVFKRINRQAASIGGSQ